MAVFAPRRNFTWRDWLTREDSYFIRAQRRRVDLHLHLDSGKGSFPLVTSSLIPSRDERGLPRSGGEYA